MRCPDCERQNRSDGRFCIYCGSSLPGPGEVEPYSPEHAADPINQRTDELSHIDYILLEVRSAVKTGALDGPTLPRIEEEAQSRQVALLMEVAGHYRERRELAQALAAYRRVVVLDPSTAEAHHEAGEVHRIRGIMEKAHEAYLKAIAARPEWAQPYLSLGILYEGQGRHAQAVREFREAAAREQDPTRRQDALRRAREMEYRRSPAASDEEPPVSEPGPPTVAALDYTLHRLASLFRQGVLSSSAYDSLQKEFLSRREALLAPEKRVPSPQEPLEAIVAGPAAEAVSRPAATPPPAPPARPKAPPRPREPFDWAAFWSALFSERTLTAILGFGVLLVAVSSLVLLISLWGDFAWGVRQAFLVGQFLLFLGMGYVVKERLELHLSGLALISVASLWVPLSVGALVFEFMPAPAERLMPGIELPLDLAMGGWLIIAATCAPIWAFMTYHFRGHLLAHGTFASVWATVALFLAVLGAAWEWQVASLAVLAIPLLGTWRYLGQTSFKVIGEPFFWTAQAALVGAAMAVLIGWTLGEAGTYSLALVGVAGAGLYALAYRFAPNLLYQYMFAGLPVVAALFALSDSRLLPIEHVDAVLIGVSIAYVVLGRRLEDRYNSGLLGASRWTALQPAYAVGYACAAAAIVWPSYEPLSRLGVLYAATAVATVSARWSDRPFWTYAAGGLLIAAVLLTLDQVEQVPLAYWSAVLGGLAWVYVGGGVALRQRPAHALPLFVGAQGLTLVAVVSAAAVAELAVLSLVLPQAVVTYAAFSLLVQRGRDIARSDGIAQVLAFFPLRLVDRVAPGEWGSVVFMVVAGALAPAWTTVAGTWADIPGPWAGLDFMALSLAYLLIGYRLARKGLRLHFSTLMALTALLMVAAPSYHAATVGLSWALVGMLYAEVVLVGLTAYALRERRLLYLAAALMTVPFALTLERLDLDMTRWAVPWAVLAAGYFVVALSLRRRSEAGTPVLAVGYFLTLLALAWSGSDSTGLMARWTLPIVGAIYACSAVLVHRRGEPSLRSPVERLVGDATRRTPTAPWLQAGAIAFGLGAAILAPAWVSLVLLWQGVDGPLHAYNPLGWAFVIAITAHLALRSLPGAYRTVSLTYGAVLVVAAVGIGVGYASQTTATGVLYGATALAVLYGFLLQSRTAIYVATVLLVAPFTLSLDMANVLPLFWGTPLMALGVAYLGVGALLPGSRRAHLTRPLSHVGLGLTWVALGWLVPWAVSELLDLDAATAMSPLGQRLLVSSGLFIGAVAYSVTARRLGDVRFGHLASWTLAVGVGVLLIATPLSLKSTAIALGVVAFAYVLIAYAVEAIPQLRRYAGFVGQHGRQTAGWGTAFAVGRPMATTGYCIASLSVALATYDLVSRDGDVAVANSVYAINVALLAASAFMFRTPAFLAGAVALFILPFSFTAYDLFGETTDLLSLPSAALAFGWTALGIGYVGIGYTIGRRWSSYSWSLPYMGYMLLGAAVAAALGSAERQSVVFGGIVLVAVASAFITHRRLTSSVADSLVTLLAMSEERARRNVTLAFVGVAGLLAPLWSLEVLALFTREASAQGLTLAVEAPVYVLAGWLVSRRAGWVYGLPLFFAAYGMTFASSALAASDELPRLLTLLAATGTYGLSLAMFRNWILVYPLLLFAHLALASFITLPTLDLGRPVVGLLFVPVAVAMALGLGATLRGAREPGALALLAPRTLPFVVFGVIDAVTSLVLAASADWAGLAASATFMAVTAAGAYATRIRVLPYATTAFTTLSVIFVSRWGGLGWSQSAIVWASQGLLMWWGGQMFYALSSREGLVETTRSRLVIWASPMRNAGLRLAWFALAFVAVLYLNEFFGFFSAAGWGAALQETSAVLAVLGLLYVGMAFVSHRVVFGYVAAALLLTSWIVQLLDREIPFAQAYAIPVGLYLLGIAFFERRRRPAALAVVIDACAVLLLLVSSFWQSVADDPAWAYAVLLAGESVLLVLWGAATNTRLPFVGGIVAFVANVLYQTSGLLSTFSGAWIGLSIGLLLVFVIAAVEWRREDLIALGRRWTARLSQWSW